MKCDQCKKYLDKSGSWLVMIKDNLWLKICKFEREIICDKCIEERLGRNLTEDDLKLPSQSYIDDYGLTEILCNSRYKENHPEKFNPIYLDN